jgi:hypothetical protein
MSMEGRGTRSLQGAMGGRVVDAILYLFTVPQRRAHEANNQHNQDAK